LPRNACIAWRHGACRQAPSHGHGFFYVAAGIFDGYGSLVNQVRTTCGVGSSFWIKALRMTCGN